MNAFKSTLVLIFSLSAFACSDDPEPPSGGNKDASVNQPEDGGLTVSDSGIVPGPRFESQDPSGPRLVLGNSDLRQDSLSVDVLGHELFNIHGLAFRVSWDPAILTLQNTEKLPGFTAAGLEKFAETQPGLLLVALGQVGTASAVNLNGAAIARLRFSRTTQAEATVTLGRGYAIDLDAIRVSFALGSGAIVHP
jgi:hypothetical protein